MIPLDLRGTDGHRPSSTGDTTPTCTTMHPRTRRECMRACTELIATVLAVDGEREASGRVDGRAYVGPPFGAARLPGLAWLNMAWPRPRKISAGEYARTSGGCRTCVLPARGQVTTTRAAVFLPTVGFAARRSSFPRGRSMARPRRPVARSRAHGRAQLSISACLRGRHLQRDPVCPRAPARVVAPLPPCSTQSIHNGANQASTYRRTYGPRPPPDLT